MSDKGRIVKVGEFNEKGMPINWYFDCADMSLATGLVVSPKGEVVSMAGYSLAELRAQREVEYSNPASAYELGRHDGAVVEREAIAEMLRTSLEAFRFKSDQSLDYQATLDALAEKVRERK